MNNKNNTNDMKTRLRLEYITDFVKGIIPEYREMLQFIEQQGGHFQLSPDFNAMIERLKVQNYPELYRDEIKLNKMALLSTMPAEQINAIGKEIEALSGDEKISALEAFATHFAQAGAEIIESIPETEEQKQTAQKLYEDMTPEEQQKAVTQVQIMLSGFIPNFFQVMSIMVHGRKLTDLVQAAEAGDDEAFCLAIQIDKRILSLPYFQERKTKAEIGQEVDFLKPLHYRMINPLLRSKIRYKTLWLTFAVLDMAGYLDGSLKYHELLDFCEEVGVAGYDNRIEDESAIGKRLREYRRFQEINQRSRH